MVEDLGDRLRNDRRTQAVYIDRAEGIENDLNLPAVCAVCAVCAGIDELGVRDTFPFEERSFLAQAVDALKRDNIDKVRQIRDRHSQSVWVGKGENQAQWQLLQAAVNLVEACDDGERQLPDHVRSQETLIDFYVVSLREVDRLQREFEVANDYLDARDHMDAVIRQARSAYRRLVGRVQRLAVHAAGRIRSGPAAAVPGPDQRRAATAREILSTPRVLEYLRESSKKRDSSGYRGHSVPGVSRVSDASAVGQSQPPAFPPTVGGCEGMCEHDSR